MVGISKKFKDRPYRCKLCRRRFKYAASMRGHQKVDHQKELFQWYQRHLSMLSGNTQSHNNSHLKPVRVSVIKQLVQSN